MASSLSRPPAEPRARTRGVRSYPWGFVSVANERGGMISLELAGNAAVAAGSLVARGPCFG